MSRPPLSESDRRLNVEFRLLAIVSTYGGERIVADNPAMDRMVKQLADEVDALAREGFVPGDDPDHVIDLREDGWTIKHPLSCRPNLFACPVNRAAEVGMCEQPPVPAGRYVCTVGPTGGLEIRSRRAQAT